MTQSYQEVKLLGKTVFEKATFEPPMRNADVMEDEQGSIWHLSIVDGPAVGSMRKIFC